MLEQRITDILENNSYAGRGIIIGCSDDGQQAIVAYFLMGRRTLTRGPPWVGRQRYTCL